LHSHPAIIWRDGFFRDLQINILTCHQVKKKLQFVAILFILLVCIIRTSQVQYIAKMNEVTLMKTGNLTSRVACGETTDKIMQTLGQPSRIENHFFEMEDRNNQIVL